eukprot:TRINITY_DN7483_c0_g1_i1.p1 TRINITY_DN7483_c0_g1~~TRINITY_DN7483_c0_g1_i1.p1  ORF type:complete len:109 (+),score=4.91 TRINITY_DN7483_c0_g1_i1:214-540(+)
MVCYWGGAKRADLWAEAEEKRCHRHDQLLPITAMAVNFKRAALRRMVWSLNANRVFFFSLLCFGSVGVRVAGLLEQNESDLYTQNEGRGGEGMDANTTWAVHIHHIPT